uniref:WD repeat protein mio zinc-ribbon like domain-containing protein n=1 Tax=Parascaris univalens TaxID=6257 RepID=A0A915AXG3_PARUN
MQCDVRWLKDHPNRFICLSPDYFALFQVEEDFKTKLLADFPLCLSQHNEQDRLRCFSLSPISDDLLALGYAYGKVLVTRAAVDPDIRALKNALELPCEVARPVVHLDFNPTSQLHLAACFDGARATDFTVCVFELNRPKLHMFHLNSPERVKATTWFADDWSLIGMGGRRTLKLYDIREGTRPLLTTFVASPIRAIRADNVRQTRFACLYDDYVCVYDRRQIDSPLYKIQLSKFPKGDMAEAKLAWNPHYPFSMTVLDRGSKMLTELLVSSCEAEDELLTHQADNDSGQLTHLRAAAAKCEAGDESTVVPSPSDQDNISESDDALNIRDEDHAQLNHPYFEVKHSFIRVPYIHSFDWHRTIRNRLLLSGVTARGESYTVKVVEVNNFVACDISPEGHIVHSNDNHLYVHQLSPVPVNGTKEPDISTAMRTRAIKDYGTPGTTALDAYIRSCKDVIDNCPYANADLKWVWKWLWQMIYITEWRPEVYGTWFPGILQVMQHSLAPKRSGSTTERIIVTDPLLGRIRVYKGKERDRVLRLCGWPPFDDIPRLDVFIDENALERMTQSRAVAAAVFTGHTGRMKKILLEMIEAAKLSNDKGRDEVEKFYDAVVHYRGVSEHWKPISEKLKKVVKDPYFTMILAFLNGRCDNYTDQHQILRLERVPLEDRIAFAAIHFNDQFFIKSIKALFTGTNLCRRLSGLFITGLSQHWETHQLLSEYVNDTGDIQTATVLLITGHCFAPVLPRPVIPISDDSLHDDFDLLNSSDEVTNDTSTHPRKYVMQSYCCVQAYQEMLNMWRLWKQRARLDCLLQWKKIYEWSNTETDQDLPEVNVWPSMRASDLEIALGKPSDDRAEAEVCCQFCARPVTLEKPELAVPLTSTLLVSTNRVAACNSTCSISSSKSTKSVNTPVLLSTRDVACQQCFKPLPKCVLCRRHMGTLTPSECPALGALSSWFTWCQRCRHGGHMVHLWHWFAKHEECAASGCLCKCELADSSMFSYKSVNVEPCTCTDGL